MKIDIKQNDNTSILKLQFKRLDSKVAPDLKSRIVILDTEEERNLVIDLSSITFADSSGLGSLLLAQRLFRDNGRKLVLAGTTERVRKLLDISQLSDVFVLVKNTEDALKYLN
ncbi:MAG: STAS domain-containing protein [Balneolales bacterium]